jgi:hypothetical protein
MGAWGTDPFDNDTAADFAADVREASDVQARQDLLLATMRAPAEKITTFTLTPGYEFGYELEMGIAAAAFVADAHTGTHEFTDNSYARGVADDEALSLLPYAELGQMTPDLLEAARGLCRAALGLMERDRVEEEWHVPVRTLLERLA